MNRVDAEVSAADFRVYATPKHFAGNDPDELVEAVSEVETSHNHRVVLYHVMSMHNYLLAWFANGLMRKQTVQFRVRWPLRGPSPISDELLTLSVFEEGNQFPSFDKLPATFCAMGRPAWCTLKHTGIVYSFIFALSFRTPCMCFLDHCSPLGPT